MKKTGYVYVITNEVNNKKYIGITKKTIKHRWNQHKNSKKNTHLYSSFQKYGIDKFKISLLKTCYTDEQLYMSEIYFIKYFKTTDRLFGYNNSTGGEISSKGRKGQIPWNKGKVGCMPIPWNKGKKGCMPPPHNKGITGVVKTSDETKKKISLANKGKQFSLGCKRSSEAIEVTRLKNKGQKRSDEFKKWISEYAKANPQYGGKKNKGKIRTDDNKKRISDTLKARTDNKGESHKMAKLNENKVREIRELASIMSAPKIAKLYGVVKSTVLNIINRKSWTHI